MGMSTVIESQFHVLAVDDSLVDRKLIERMLKTKSFQVTTVDSGSKALEFLGIHENDQNNLLCQSVSPSNKQDVQVNLVITDYCMPGMTGYDLLKKMKESSSMRDIPVVIMSSENVPSRIARCLEEGAEEFFLKPVGLADLNKLRQLMETSMKVQKQEKQGKQEQHEVDLQTIDSQLQQLQQEQVPKLEHQAELKLQQLHQEQLPQLKHQEESKLQLLQQEQVPKLEHQAELKLQQLHQEQLPQLKHQEESKLQQSEQEQLLPQEQEPTTPDNKRKTVEDGLPPERARPRYEYDGLITMV